MFIDQNVVRRSMISRLPEADIAVMKSYIQASVCSFCNNNPDAWFGIRDLFGRANGDWRNTPLQRVYDYYCRIGNRNPYNTSARAVGWLLKDVIDNDKRYYEMRKAWIINTAG